jgi:hypothetical protein
LKGKEKACREDILRCLDKISAGKDHQKTVIHVFEPLVKDMLFELVDHQKGNEEYPKILRDVYPVTKQDENFEKYFWLFFGHICKQDGSSSNQRFVANIALATLRIIEQLFRCKSSGKFDSRDPYVHAMMLHFQEIGFTIALDIFLDSDDLKFESNHRSDKKTSVKPFHCESLAVVEAWVQLQCRKVQNISGTNSRALNDLNAYLERMGDTFRTAPSSLIFRDNASGAKLQVTKFITSMLKQLRSCDVAYHPQAQQDIQSQTETENLPSQNTDGEVYPLEVLFW